MFIFSLKLTNINFYTVKFNVFDSSTLLPFQSAGVAVPDVNFTVSIFNTTDDGDDFYDESDPLQTTSYTFSGVPKGRNYAIELVVTNVIGNSFTTQFFPSKLKLLCQFDY